MKPNKSIQGQTIHHKPWIWAGLVVAGLVIVGVWVARPQETRAGDAPETATDVSRVPVVVTFPVRRTFAEVIETQGNVEAKHVVMVSPRIGGILERIDVDEGDPVTAGETVLFQTDATTLQQNVIINEHEVAVAHCAQLQAQANLEKVQADLDKAALDFHRFERLLERNATTQDAFEQQQSRYKQLVAAEKLARAQVSLEAEKYHQAQADLAIAQKNLADTTVKASMSGVVSIRYQEPGEMGSPGRAVLRIEDTSLMEVSTYLPAAVYPRIEADQTHMKVVIYGMDLGPQTITYKSPTIHPKLRTFEVKTILETPRAGVAPGAMAEVAVVLESHEGLGVPTEAIQQRGARSVVFVVENNKTRLVPVTTGLESNGWTEIITGGLKAQDRVIHMGQFMVQDGTDVTVQEEGR
jgi:RND family efflux transporter MFP subunit